MNATKFIFFQANGSSFNLYYYAIHNCESFFISTIITVLFLGEFTCQVSDWGTVQNKTIQVSIASVPQPHVAPVTSTVHLGDRVVITCLSKDDMFGSFGYNWLKNGRILNPSAEPELVEDLFPAGSRIVIQSARASTTYTCIITSTAGATRKDSTVTVLISKGNALIYTYNNLIDVFHK